MTFGPHVQHYVYILFHHYFTFSLHHHVLLQLQRAFKSTKVEMNIQNCNLEWNHDFSNLVMEILPQFYNVASHRLNSTEAAPTPVTASTTPSPSLGRVNSLYYLVILLTLCYLP